ncbi:unnamed protein product [Acanthosepion pharaonis]|uniref:IPT/TIG domain-containing protein n=1 Tax=Acanthosepion pharaonis TaxID=158019 RepID=A0A812DET5_ACAPH|nr:unnamed protein product [Sepia pharaonis]
MAFSPTESPVYGGDELTVTVDNLDLPSTAEFFILYTGSKERRVTRAQRINSATFQGNIPDHALEENVELEVFCKSEKDGSADYKRIGNGQFRYLNDSAHSLAKKLLDINTDQEIKLDIENEDLSTLDTRLKKSLEHITKTEGWPDDIKDKEHNNRNTLLHFAAHHGLSQVVSLVVSGISDEAIQTTNSQGKTARELALDQGHKEISDLLSDSCTRSVVKPEIMMFERNGAVVHKNHNGAISIATPHIDGDSVTSDMDLLNAIEIEMTQKEQENAESSQDKILEESTGENTEIKLSEENQPEDISQDDDAGLDITGNEEADSLKCTPVEEKVDSEMVPEEEVVIANDENEIKTDKENDAAVSNTITDIATDAAVIECVGDKESPCEVEDNVESLFEDSGEKVIEEITEEHDKDTQHLLNEKLEILEEDLEENKMGKNQDDASKTEEAIPSNVSLSFPLPSLSLTTTDTNSFVTAQETVATATDESKTDELNDFEAVLDSAATGTPSEDTSMPVSQEVSPEESHEVTAAVETPLSEEADSEIVRAEEESPNSDESTDSDSSLPLPSSPPPPPPPPPTSQEANIDNVDLHTTCSDRSFTGGDNSSLSGRISTGVTGVAFDEIVMRKHNKDKVDLGPVMGEMCILDPLLEERETSEESIGKPPMILPTSYPKKEAAFALSHSLFFSLSLSLFLSLTLSFSLSHSLFFSLSLFLSLSFSLSLFSLSLFLSSLFLLSLSPLFLSPLFSLSLFSLSPLFSLLSFSLLSLSLSSSFSSLSLSSSFSLTLFLSPLFSLSSSLSLSFLFLFSLSFSLSLSKL